jgi:hypothetical protein
LFDGDSRTLSPSLVKDHTTSLADELSQQVCGICTMIINGRAANHVLLSSINEQPISSSRCQVSNIRI